MAEFIDKENSMALETQFEVPRWEDFRFITKKTMSRVVDFCDEGNKRVLVETIKTFFSDFKVENSSIKSEDIFMILNVNKDKSLTFIIRCKRDIYVKLNWYYKGYMKVRIEAGLFLEGIDFLKFVSDGTFDGEKLGGESNEL